mmetsp:Transcript_104432/g.302122  ORF Transcript_104432/g.302122 Transcript_104432/m.302122 type:complete len:208 (-) Transcript_104432:946-1569(-)
MRQRQRRRAHDRMPRRRLSAPRSRRLVRRRRLGSAKLGRRQVARSARPWQGVRRRGDQQWRLSAECAIVSPAGRRPCGCNDAGRGEPMPACLPRLLDHPAHLGGAGHALRPAQRLAQWGARQGDHRHVIRQHRGPGRDLRLEHFGGDLLVEDLHPEELRLPALLEPVPAARLDRLRRLWLGLPHPALMRWPALRVEEDHGPKHHGGG